MNLEDVDRELDSFGPTPASLPIERLGDLAEVDAVLASLGEGVPLATPPARSTATAPTRAVATKPATPPKPSAVATPPAPPVAKPPSAPRPPAPKSAMPPPKSVMPRVPAPEPTRQVVAPAKSAADPADPGKTPSATDSSTRQVVAPSPSSPGSLSADDLFADLADDDVPSAASERPVEPAETASETTNETSGPLAELFSDLDEEVAEVGNLFEEEPPSEERLSLELGDFDDLVPETGTTSALPSVPPPPSTAPSVPAPSTLRREPAVAAAGPSDDFDDDFEEPVAESTSLFSAADVAAIPVPAVPSSAPLDELVLEDDFELLIDDDEADDSTFVGKAEDVEASGDAAEQPGDDEDPSGKKGFFKKLFG